MSLETRFAQFMGRNFKDKASVWGLGGHTARVDGKRVKIAKQIATWDGKRKIKALNDPVEVFMGKARVVDHEVLLIPETIVTSVIVEPGDYVTVGDHDSSKVLHVRRHVK